MNVFCNKQLKIQKKTGNFAIKRSKMKKSILLSCLLIATTIAHAIPALKLWRTYTQRDGSTIRVLMVGDEHLHYFVTDDQVPLVQRDNNFFYAKIEKNKLVSSNVLAHESSLRTAFEKKNVRTVQEIEPLREKAPTRLQQLSRLPLVRKGKYTGKKKGLIILVNFSDNSFRDDDPQKVFDEIVNKSGYKDYGGVGSVHDYFYDQSNGRFDLTFDVMGPVQLKHPLAYYGGDKNGQTDVRVSEMIVEACQAVNDKVDYRNYDWDNDGVVDQVVVIYAGYGQATSAKPETIWPHEFNIKSKNLVLDGVKINTYACSNELYEYNTGTGIGRVRNTLMGIGVICHEFSHCLGLPDFYDTGKSRNYGMGQWDIMARGSYNGPLSIGWIPPAYTSYEKNFAGWLDYKVLGDKPQTVTNMKPLQQGGEAYVIYNPQNHNEYYLLENKGADKWDSHLPKNGLLVLHVDYDASLWAYNIVNNTEQKQYNNHQRLTIVPAAGSFGNSDRDTYPLGERDSLTANSTPALTLYNANWDNGHVLHNKVLNIRKDANGLISFNYLPDPHFYTAGTEQTLNGNGAATIVSIHDMRGLRMPAKQLYGLPRGLYLLNLSDGTTRKVLVK